MATNTLAQVQAVEQPTFKRVKVRTFTDRLVRGIFTHAPATISLFIIIFFVLVAIFAPAIAPHDPIKVDIIKRLQPPAWQGGLPGYVLGTDQMGRDVLSRLIFGTRVSLQVGIFATIIAVILGATLGIIAGFYGGRVDDIIMRLNDAQRAFPFLVLAIAIIAAVGQGLDKLIMVLGVFGWANYGRFVRGETLSLREKEFVEAARTIGATNMRIMFVHILPNVMSTLLVLSSFSVAALIIAESSLSFLGLGVPLPTPSWGNMLSDGREYMETAWWLAIFPGVTIGIIVLAVNILGDRLRDIFDARTNL
ncbi:MAG: peptide ABC transporter permease [Dehalococcoidia bacterium]|nr:MAG: peptide ABC transporter permease [Dehalococcoidia bacterium]